MKKNIISTEESSEMIDIDRNSITSAIIESMYDSDNDITLQDALNTILHSIILQEIETKNYISKIQIQKKGNEKIIEYLNKSNLYECG